MDRPEFSEVRRDMLQESLSYYQQFIDEQRARIRNIQVQYRNQHRWFGGHGPGPGDRNHGGTVNHADGFRGSGANPNEEPPDSATVDAVAQILACLTSSQTNTWASLTGPAFHGHVTLHGPGWMATGMAAPATSRKRIIVSGAGIKS